MDPSAFVLYDLPPLLESDDFLAFLPRVDAALLVVAEGTTPRKSLAEAKELIDSVKLIGIVLNKSHAKLATYY